MLMSKVSVLHIDGKIAADTSASPCWSSPARRVPHVPTTSPCRGAQDRLRDGRWQKLVDGLGRQLAEGCSQLSREVAQSSEINRQRLQELVEAGRCHCVSIQSTRLRVFFFFPFILFVFFPPSALQRRMPEPEAQNDSPLGTAEPASAAQLSGNGVPGTCGSRRRDTVRVSSRLEWMDAPFSGLRMFWADGGCLRRATGKWRDWRG